MRRAMALAAVAAMLAAGPASAAARRHMPGITLEVLAAGPASGVQPVRGDQVTMRYVGRLVTGEVFSTSAKDGAEPSPFKVREVIPGMSAALQLMRPGDRWRITLPGYLAYGRLGRRYQPPEANLKRDIPPDATLVFEVELVSVAPAAP